MAKSPAPLQVRRRLARFPSSPSTFAGLPEDRQREISPGTFSGLPGARKIKTAPSFPGVPRPSFAGVKNEPSFAGGENPHRPLQGWFFQKLVLPVQVHTHPPLQGVESRILSRGITDLLCRGRACSVSTFAGLPHSQTRPPLQGPRTFFPLACRHLFRSAALSYLLPLPLT